MLPVDVVVGFNVMDYLAEIVFRKGVLRLGKKTGKQQACGCERSAIPHHGRSLSFVSTY
jgi:hypothetical protein